MNLKVNDKLYCYNTTLDDNMRYMYSCVNRKLTINKGYTIHRIEKSYYSNTHGIMVLIINDMNNQDWYSIDDCDEWYYKKWFCTECEYRKLKLKRLKDAEDRG